MVDGVTCQVSTAEEKASNRGLHGGYKPYPTYTPSGVDWLGEIPAHWKARRLKSFTVVQLSNVDKKSTEGQEAVRLCNYTDVYYNEHIGPDIEFMPATATKEQVRRFTLRAGDVLITKDSEDWTDIAVPAVVTQDLPGVLCGYHLALIRPDSRCDGAFLSRALSACGPRDQYQLSANGITRYGLTGDSIRASVLVFPSLAEQRAIAAFLDRETAKIDSLVAKKERLIELLQEKRTALISRSATKGLDSDVSMKDSGVDWLGEIPEHWEVKRLKSFATVQLSNVDKKSAEGQDAVQLCNYTDVYYNEEIGSDVEFMAATATKEQIRRFSLTTGDVLITKDSEEWTDIAVPAVVTQDLSGVLCGYHLAHVRPGDGCDGAFLSRAFAAIGPRDQYQVSANGITRYGLTGDSIRASVLALPPLAEQRVIAAFLDRETAKGDELITKVQEAIERLKELRAALISAAVTGKIDVRQEAA